MVELVSKSKIVTLDRDECKKAEVLEDDTTHNADSMSMGSKTPAHDGSMNY